MHCGLGGFGSGGYMDIGSVVFQQHARHQQNGSSSRAVNVRVAVSLRAAMSSQLVARASPLEDCVHHRLS